MSNLSSETYETETSPTTDPMPESSPESSKEEKRRAGLAKGRATVAANRAAKRKTVPSNAVSATRLETTGIAITISDGHEHQWTIPAETDDAVVGGHQSVFELRHFKGYDERFTYEFHHDEEIASMYTDEWVGVTRTELGLESLPAAVTAKYGSAPDNFYRVGNQLCLKKPKVLVDRTHKAMDNYRKTLMSGMKPRSTNGDLMPKDRLEQGGLVKEEIREQSTFQEPVAITR